MRTYLLNLEVGNSENLLVKLSKNEKSCFLKMAYPQALLLWASINNSTTDLEIYLEIYFRAYAGANDHLALVFLSNLLSLAFERRSLNFAEELIRLQPEVVAVWPINREDGTGGAAHITTAMHTCCLHGYLPILKLLLRHHPGLSRKKDQAGRIPLHIAATKDDVEILQEILMVDPDCIMLVTDDVLKETVLHVAARHGRPYCFLFLLNHCLESKKTSSLFKRKDHQGNSVLHTAVSTKNLLIIEMLMEKNHHKRPLVKVNAKNRNGFTALKCHNQYSSETNNDNRITELLLKFGAKDEKIPTTTMQRMRNRPSATDLSVFMAVVIFFAGGSFAALSNYRDIFPMVLPMVPQIRSDKATEVFNVKEVISSPTLLPADFYFVLVTTILFIPSNLTIALIIWPLKGSGTFTFRAVTLFLISVAFVVFGLMVKLFVPLFSVKILGGMTVISSVWFVWLFSFAVILLFSTLLLIAKCIYSCFDNKL